MKKGVNKCLQYRTYIHERLPQFSKRVVVDIVAMKYAGDFLEQFRLQIGIECGVVQGPCAH